MASSLSAHADTASLFPIIFMAIYVESSGIDMLALVFKLRRMPTVHVDLAERSYDVRVDAGILSRSGSLMAEAGLGGRRAAVISDDTVARLHGATLMESLDAAGFSPTLHTVNAGEASKSMSHAERLCREMIRAGHDRKSIVVALGGGVVGDLAGFVAAIFYRGLPFVQVPTTIVAQVDSSVGGKTGVNVAEGKNLLGAFHQPRLVVVDPDTLRTLPDREFHEGFAEAIKHAAIRDAPMLDDLAALDPASRAVPADLIARNIAIKARVVESDEHETLGIRALLNFGHTIGHGIEAAVPYGEMLHGEAIALGMKAALHLSERHAGLSPEASTGIKALLEKFHLPQVLPESIATETVMKKLATDKKFSAGAIRFVVLDAAGSARVTDTVTANDLREAVEWLRA
jgi:3-dehydroquinate synthase